MISLTKRSKFGYPVKNLFYAAGAEDVPALSPWSVAILKQADSSVRDACEANVVECQPFYTLVHDLSQPESVLWKRLARTRKRDITRGEQEPIEISINCVERDQVYQIMECFYAGKRLVCPTRAYFNLILSHCDIWATSWGGELALVHAMMKDFPTRVRVMYGCHIPHLAMSSAIRSQLNSTLFWRAMLHYQSLGFQSFDMGGVFIDKQSPSYGVTVYKQTYGGDLRVEWDLALAGQLVRPFWNIAMRYHDTNAIPSEVD